MRCKTCHYSLEGLSENRCPECGREFDPDDPTTFSIEIAAKAKLLRTNRVILIVFIGQIVMVAVTIAGTWGLGFLDRSIFLIFGAALVPLMVGYAFNCWRIRRVSQ